MPHEPLPQPRRMPANEHEIGSPFLARRQQRPPQQRSNRTPPLMDGLRLQAARYRLPRQRGIHVQIYPLATSDCATSSPHDSSAFSPSSTTGRTARYWSSPIHTPAVVRTTALAPSSFGSRSIGRPPSLD